MTDRDLSKIDDVTLLAAAAHELKNPLTVILGMSSMLEEEAFGKLRTKQKEQVRHIIKASHKLGLLVDSLIHLDNLEHQRPSCLMQLQTQIERVIEEVSEISGDKDITVEFQPRRLPLIFADPASIYQLLLHIISNSIRYAPAGSIVRVEARRKKGQVMVEVHSGGYGMTPKEARTIKQRVGRQRQPVRAYSSSSGLGMYIAQSIVEFYGGSLRVVKQQQGNCVILRLPASKQLELWGEK